MDDFHGRGTFWGTVEEYLNHTYWAAHGFYWPDRYDVNSPELLVGNSLASSAHASHLRDSYDMIIWDSGTLDYGTIGDGSIESDKADDCTLLIDWMNYHEFDRACMWILGDNVAKDLSGLTSPQAAELMNTWCGVTL